VGKQPIAHKAIPDTQTQLSEIKPPASGKKTQAPRTNALQKRRESEIIKKFQQHLDLSALEALAFRRFLTPYLSKYFGELPSKKSTTPAERYADAKTKALSILLIQGKLIYSSNDVNADGIRDMERYGPSAGKSKDQIKADIRKIYEQAYEIRLGSLMDRARQGAENSDFIKEFSKWKDFGRQAGKPLQDMGQDEQKIYQVFFDRAYGETCRLAERGQDDSKLYENLRELHRYGSLAGKPFMAVTLEKTIFKTLYQVSLKNLESALLLKGCADPETEIVFRGNALEIQGVGYNQVVSYGAAAGLTPADMAKDMRSLIDKIKNTNQKEAWSDLIDETEKLLGTPFRQASAIWTIMKRANGEALSGFDQLAGGVVRCINETNRKKVLLDMTDDAKTLLETPLRMTRALTQLQIDSKKELTNGMDRMAGGIVKFIHNTDGKKLTLDFIGKTKQILFI
jgi:hypothetical protein